MAGFNPAAFFIVLREVLEMSLVVGIMLGYCTKCGFRHLHKYVWAGTAAGVVLAVGIGAAFGAVYHKEGTSIFSGDNQAIFQGSIMTLASVLLSWMVLWSKATGADLAKTVENQIQVALDKGASWRIFLIPFVQILREGIETIVFMAGVDAGSGGPGDLIGPSIVGIVVAIAVAYLLLKGIMRFSVRVFFDVTAYILLFFSAGMLSYGFHWWQTAGFFGPWDTKDGRPITPMERPWVNQPLWSTKSMAGDVSQFFAIARVLFGYYTQPNFITVIVYTLYWIAALIIIHGMSARAGMIKESTIRKYMIAMRFQSGIMIFWYFLTFIWACVVSQHPYQAFLISILGSACHTCAIVASLKTEKVSERAKAICSQVNFYLWIWVSLFSYIVILVQLDCAGRGLCGTYGTDYYYVFFIFNRRYNTGPRMPDSWRTGAVLTMSLVIYIFQGYFHGIFSYYLMKAKGGKDFFLIKFWEEGSEQKEGAGAQDNVVRGSTSSDEIAVQKTPPTDDSVQAAAQQEAAQQGAAAAAVKAD